MSEALSRSLALLGKSDFFRAGGGCAGCHHQVSYARAYAAVQSAHFPADASLRSAFRDAQLAERPRLWGVLPYLSSFGGDIDILLPRMVAQDELGEEANADTDLILHFLACRQDVSGAWLNLGIARPPIEDSTITRTAYAIQALARYGWPARMVEFEERVTRARAWLENAKPETTYEQADRLIGLRAAGLSSASLRADATELVKLQHDDGGWAQTPFLGVGRLRHRDGARHIVQDRSPASGRSGVPARRGLPDENTIPRWFVVCAQPGSEISTLLPERLPFWRRSMDSEFRNSLGGDGVESRGG